MVVLASFEYFGKKISDKKIKKITEQLERHKFKIGYFDFAQSNEVTFNVFGHRVSVGYREV